MAHLYTFLTCQGLSSILAAAVAAWAVMTAAFGSATVDAAGVFGTAYKTNFEIKCLFFISGVVGWCDGAG